MAKSANSTVKLSPSFTTKSGQPLGIGSGSGTKWKTLKRSDPDNASNGEIIISQIQKSIALGFRHIDTAEAYTTHLEVGEAIRRSGVSREDIWITTKYDPGSRFFKKVNTGPEDFVRIALEELDTYYIDLLLIHHPFFDEKYAKGYNIESAWKELIKAKKSGKVREIGVSNFTIDHLKKIIKISEPEGPEFFPVVNQIEFHPYLQNQSPDTNRFCQENNILVEAYGPLTPLFRIVDENKTEIKDHPLKAILPKLAEKYGKTEAQILLRYTLQKGILPITTSSKKDRIKESLEIFEYELDHVDVKLIDSEGSKFDYRAFFYGYF